MRFDLLEDTKLLGITIICIILRSYRLLNHNCELDNNVNVTGKD